MVRTRGADIVTIARGRGYLLLAVALVLVPPAILVTGALRSGQFQVLTPIFVVLVITATVFASLWRGAAWAKWVVLAFMALLFVQIVARVLSEGLSDDRALRWAAFAQLLSPLVVVTMLSLPSTRAFLDAQRVHHQGRQIPPPV